MVVRYIVDDSPFSPQFSISSPFFQKILLTVLTVPVVQLKLQNITFSNAKGITRSGQ